MKKKSQTDLDIAGFMAKIQEQLAVMDQKLDSFMTKSLTELAQAPVRLPPGGVIQKSPQPASRPLISEQRPRLSPQGSRPMYAVICFDCGKNTEIPFKPSGDRPVYCKECFAKRKAGNAPQVNQPRPAMPFVKPPAPAGSVSAKPKHLVQKKKSATAKKPAAKKKAVVKKKAKK